MLAAGQVVSAIAGRISGATAAGSRVYTDRVWPVTEPELPLWRVTAGAESMTALYLDGKTYDDDVEVNAAAYVRANDGLDQAMNALAESALAAIFAAPVRFGLELIGIEREMQDVGQANLGVITLNLRAHITFDVTQPGTILTTP